MTTPLSYTLPGAAEATGLSKSHLDRAIRAGQLRAKRTSNDKDGNPAGRVVILASALASYLESMVDA